MKNFLIIFMAMIMVSCSSLTRTERGSDGTVTEVEVENPEEVKVPEVEVVEVGQDNELLEVTKFTGFTTGEINRFWQYNAAMNKTINSKCFYDFLVARSRGLNGAEYKMHSMNGNSVDELMSILRGKKPKLEFEMYYSNNSTVGYTYPERAKIWFNKKFHQFYGICKAAANLGHEISHKLGFDHASNYSRYRNYSVPYSINFAFGACCVE